MKESVRIVKFVFFSISAGLIEIGTFALLNETLHWPYWLSYMIALILSVLWNFTFNRKYTFKSANNVPKAMFQVFLYYLVFTPLSTWWGHALTGLGINDYVILVFTMLVNFITEFLFQKYVVFKPENN